MRARWGKGKREASTIPVRLGLVSGWPRSTEGRGSAAAGLSGGIGGGGGVFGAGRSSALGKGSGVGGRGFAAKENEGEES